MTSQLEPKTCACECGHERMCFESDMNEWYGRGNW